MAWEQRLDEINETITASSANPDAVATVCENILQELKNCQLMPEKMQDQYYQRLSETILRVGGLISNLQTTSALRAIIAVMEETLCCSLLDSSLHEAFSSFIDEAQSKLVVLTAPTSAASLQPNVSETSLPRQSQKRPDAKPLYQPPAARRHSTSQTIASEEPKQQSKKERKAHRDRTTMQRNSNTQSKRTPHPSLDHNTTATTLTSTPALSAGIVTLPKAKWEELQINEINEISGCRFTHEHSTDGLQGV